MKENKTWIAIGITLFIGAMTRRILNTVGGIKSFPYMIQIIVMVLIPAIIFMVIRKERKKMNKFQYALSKMFIIFFIVMSSIISVVIVLNNSFPLVWEQYKSIFEIIIPVLLLLYAIYMVIFILRNIKNIK